MDFSSENDLLQWIFQKRTFFQRFQNEVFFWNLMEEINVVMNQALEIVCNDNEYQTHNTEHFCVIKWSRQRISNSCKNLNTATHSQFHIKE